MAHIKRIDLTRDVEAHAEAYRKAIENVCKETAFSGGKYADAFDKEFAAYVGSKFASGVNNGTSALHLAMLALGVGPGDEVIVPANTYIATAWGVSYTGATPVFADCTPDTWEIDPSVLEAKITEKTKGIIGVHLYGQPFDYAGVRKIADRHGLFVVEDCAQAHGAKFEDRNVGTLGDLACFSFYPGKNLYAFGEGGSVTCQEEKYYKHIDRLKNQGCDVRYYHDEIGYNYRLEGLQGAVLSVSLKYLPEWTKRRQEIGHRYLKEITNPLITMQRHPENTTPVFHLFVITVPDHEDFIRYMAANDVECNMHYPVPCHLQKAYANLGYQPGDCPNAEYLAAHCVTLPLFPEMREDEITCQEEKYYKHIDRLKNQGCDVRYYHDEIGYNYRLEGLQGAVLSVSLKYLPEWTKRRQEIGHRYLKEITNPLITMQRHPENTTPVFHLFVITVPDHEDFIRYMAANDVECNMHYPVPCHLQKAYANLGYQPGDCPNAEYLAAHCVTLPLFPEMREDEITRVIDLCNAYRQA